MQQHGIIIVAWSHVVYIMMHDQQFKRMPHIHARGRKAGRQERTQQSSTSTFEVESGSIPSSFAMPSSRGALTFTYKVTTTEPFQHPMVIMIMVMNTHRQPNPAQRTPHHSMHSIREDERSRAYQRQQEPQEGEEGCGSVV